MAGKLHDPAREWLEAEQAGRDELAEAMFAGSLAGLPACEPSSGFVARAARVAWRRRRRRLMVGRLARTAAALLAGTLVAGAAYGFGWLAFDLVARGSALLADVLVWMAASVTAGVRWWVVAGEVGSTVAGVLAAPGTAAIVLALELLAATAIYGFDRLLRNGRQHEEREVRA